MAARMGVLEPAHRFNHAASEALLGWGFGLVRLALGLRPDWAARLGGPHGGADAFRGGSGVRRLGDHQGSRDRGQALTTAGQAQAVGRGARHAHASPSQGIGQDLLRLVPAR
jgi:hypothetical protein